MPNVPSLAIPVLTPDALGQTFRAWRKAKGLTCKMLSMHTGISESYLKDLELNKVYPRMQTLKQLANFYGYSIVIEIKPHTKPVEPSTVQID